MPSFSGEVGRTSSRATSTLSNGDAFVNGSSPVASEIFFVLLLQICLNKHVVPMLTLLGCYCNPGAPQKNDVQPQQGFEAPFCEFMDTLSKKSDLIKSIERRRSLMNNFCIFYFIKTKYKTKKNFSWCGCKNFGFLTSSTKMSIKSRIFKIFQCLQH